MFLQVLTSRMSACWRISRSWYCLHSWENQLYKQVKQTLLTSACLQRSKQTKGLNLMGKWKRTEESKDTTNRRNRALVRLNLSPTATFTTRQGNKKKAREAGVVAEGLQDQRHKSSGGRTEGKAFVGLQYAAVYLLLNSAHFYSQHPK